MFKLKRVPSNLVGKFNIAFYFLAIYTSGNITLASANVLTVTKAHRLIIHKTE